MSKQVKSAGESVFRGLNFLMPSYNNNKASKKLNYKFHLEQGKFMLSTTALILAAGHGKRMNSRKSKVLHEVGGLPMIMHVYKSVIPFVEEKPIVVVGSNIKEVKDLMGDSVRYVVQDQPLGTGHAAMSAVELLRGSTKQVIVMYGDMPLIRKETIKNLLNLKEQTNATIAMVTIEGDITSTFGRVVRDQLGYVAEVVEWADAKQRTNSSRLLGIQELNAGLYCFDTNWFCENVGAIIPRPSRDYNEYYLTDIFRIATDQKCLVVAEKATFSDEFFGISTTEDIAKADTIFQAMRDSPEMS